MSQFYETFFSLTDCRRKQAILFCPLQAFPDYSNIFWYGDVSTLLESAPERCCTFVSCGLNYKYQTRLKGFARDKHASLLDEKKVLKTWQNVHTQCQFSPKQFSPKLNTPKAVQTFTNFTHIFKKFLHTSYDLVTYFLSAYNIRRQSL